jgi:hypothetical protein
MCRRGQGGIAGDVESDFVQDAGAIGGGTVDIGAAGKGEKVVGITDWNEAAAQRLSAVIRTVGAGQKKYIRNGAIRQIVFCDGAKSAVGATAAAGEP